MINSFCSPFTSFLFFLLASDLTKAVTYRPRPDLVQIIGKEKGDRRLTKNKGDDHSHHRLPRDSVHVNTSTGAFQQELESINNKPVGGESINNLCKDGKDFQREKLNKQMPMREFRHGSDYLPLLLCEGRGLIDGVLVIELWRCSE